eukprot:CAMPEP_0204576710 /NCGR_PEP_ID=MMETSP0661-20131031/41928_1 /ASSEMBLY_ACC=CAM_ASM_000606 /TAXON_ID=109239 /ORGANISM="Alexandrium margalefi, Strain AMGDE01CS-322" /LENGTH=55 /DNA_ID=CAMNT_0051585483 /DNA_START=403 /DNA_END=567 /DNA_ORIENTATION=-
MKTHRLCPSFSQALTAESQKRPRGLAQSLTAVLGVATSSARRLWTIAALSTKAPC